MSDIQILLDEQQSLTFDVEIQGVDDISKIEPRFIIETTTVELMFKGKFDGEKVNVRIPILSNILENSEYNCRLEFVVEGEKFFTPMQALLEAVLPTRISAGVSNDKVQIPASDVTIMAKPKVTVTPQPSRSFSDIDKLTAISQLLLNRSNVSESAETKLGIEAFVQFARKMGMSVSKKTLREMSEQGSLKSIIKEVNDTQVIFNKKEDIKSDMTLKEAKQIVESLGHKQ